ncbi:hypothetical protein PpBr36_05280 [Pyricularia pennisetigena]|uniref:hypothetical protein n=1 Tax=Pyricularia pennisetigena TaxID=1578925 RepID=UPI001152FBF7|nr:hypothetical protein PpBr36_05280 [Pyricularia pennisetigena]TLS26628.1 hypothetical protein PpBr36_05280 [Pyricularia pennisetigena]
MRPFIISILLAGLATASRAAIQPREEVDFQMFPVTGPRCCGHELVEDINGRCKSAGLKAYCCSRYRSDITNGCDGGDVSFKVGREVQVAWLETMSKCVANNQRGFVGCTK